MLRKKTDFTKHWQFLLCFAETKLWLKEERIKQNTVSSGKITLLRSVKGYVPSEKIKNYNIREALNTLAIRDTLNSYRQKWTGHLNKMSHGRLLKSV
jgi:hypothetical protein